MNKIIEERLSLLVTSCITISFLYLALSRHLNFDESLLLRSAWLEVTQTPHDFPFKMPLITLLSPLTVFIHEPYILLITLRTIIALSIFGAFTYIYISLRLPHTTGALWICLCALSSTFITHAFEFRYDAAILVAWMIAFGTFYSKNKYKYFYIGLICGWLATHHIKGAFYALSLYSAAIIAIKINATMKTRKTIILTASTAIIPAAWLLITSLTKSTREIYEFYNLFFELSKAQEQSYTGLTGAAGAIKKDLPWLAMCILTAVLINIRKPHHASTNLMIAFSCVPIFFIAIHPHPWAYMLAPAIPFISLITATALSSSIKNTKVMMTLTLSLTTGALYHIHYQHQKHAADYSLSATAAVMSIIMEHALPDDGIVDPSGIIYFLKPAPLQWYTDTLFRNFANKGRWQADAEEHLKQAEWVLDTYRLNWLPIAGKERINEAFSANCGPIRLRQEDERAKRLTEHCTLSHTSIPSAW